MQIKWRVEQEEGKNSLYFSQVSLINIFYLFSIYSLFFVIYRETPITHLELYSPDVKRVDPGKADC